MNITAPISWTAFLLTLSTLNLAAVATPQTPVETRTAANISLEDRLTRIASALKMREQQRPQPNPNELAGWANGRSGGGFANTRGPGWGNTSGGGGFVNTRGPGWGNTSGGGGFVNTRGPGWGNVSGGGGFVNTSPFRNGWSDGGSFLNRR
ncbi:MAG: GrrA/OscA1 family cyclophane-containing rSAM-modified RiPP [Microcystaceae cyanobacterium]